jgi:hypothetical protein
VSYDDYEAEAQPLSQSKPKYIFVDGEDENVQFIDHTIDWLTKFLDDFKDYRKNAQFPEMAFANQSISMVEDMATQIAIKAAEIQTARQPKE